MDHTHSVRKGLDACVESHLRALLSHSQTINASLKRSRYLKQTIDQSSPSQLTALMKFLQPFDESSGGRCFFSEPDSCNKISCDNRPGSVGVSASKPVSPIADDKAEEVRFGSLGTTAIPYSPCTLNLYIFRSLSSNTSALSPKPKANSSTFLPVTARHTTAAWSHPQNHNNTPSGSTGPSPASDPFMLYLKLQY